jgi:hypothetical protein
LEHFFSIQLGLSSSQLTNSIIFQRGRYTIHQPEDVWITNPDWATIIH